MNASLPLPQRFQSAMDNTAKWGALLAMAGIPTAISAVNIGLALVLAGWLLSGNFRWKWAVIRDNPITLPCLLLAALVLAGIAWSEAPARYIGRHLYVYSKLPLMLMLLTVLHESLWQRRALAAYAAGALVTLASTYANLWVHVPWSDSFNEGFGATHNVFNDYIAQGLAMSFFTALAVVYALEAKDRRLRSLWWAVVALTVFSITHLLQGRTGQLVLAAMFAALIFTAVPPAWRWRALLAALAVLALVFLSSPLLRSRVALIFVEYREYFAVGTVSTSTGARLDMWKNAFEMFLGSPLWGHGTAMYRVLSERIYTDAIQCSVSCIHPHNQFLFFAAEFGLAGVVAYALLLWRPLRAALRMQGSDRLLLVALLAIMFVDSFLNGPLWVTTERHLFATVLPVLVAGWLAKTGNQETQGGPAVPAADGDAAAALRPRDPAAKANA